MVDADVWVLAEKSGGTLSLARWPAYGGAYMSTVTASELLVGVERANTAPRRALRSAFVENLLAIIPVIEFLLLVARPHARTHARMIAALSKNVIATAHDAIIAATAVHCGHALLTRNVADFKIFQGLQVEVFRDVA